MSEQSKNLLTVHILEVLHKYSDANHPLSQKQISEYLQKDYEMKVDRKTLKRNLSFLCDAGYPLHFTSKDRENRYGEETVATDWYIERNFKDSELRLLVDSVLFYNDIPKGQSKRLLEKLRQLSSIHFQQRTKHIHGLGDKKAVNEQLFSSISVLDEAIDKKLRVRFLYGQYDIDKKLHTYLDEAGQPKIYQADPYQMVTNSSHYYLICHDNQHDGIWHYRIDRILDVELLDERRTPLKKITGQANALDLPKHIAEHIYMFAGPAIRIRFRIERKWMNQVFDWFGSDVELENITASEADVIVYAQEEAMLRWALQFGDLIEVLQPKSLRQALYKEHQSGVDKYSD